MEGKPQNVFDRILYGLKVANDNIVVLNDKIDALIKIFSTDTHDDADMHSCEQ